MERAESQYIPEEHPSPLPKEEQEDYEELVSLENSIHRIHCEKDINQKPVLGTTEVWKVLKDNEKITHFITYGDETLGLEKGGKKQKRLSYLLELFAKGELTENEMRELIHDYYHPYSVKVRESKKFSSAS